MELENLKSRLVEIIKGGCFYSDEEYNYALDETDIEYIANSIVTDPIIVAQLEQACNKNIIAIKAQIDLAENLLSLKGYSEYHKACFVSERIIQNELKELKEQYERLLKHC